MFIGLMLYSSVGVTAPPGSLNSGGNKHVRSDGEFISRANRSVLCVVLILSLISILFSVIQHYPYLSIVMTECTSQALSLI